MKEKDIEMEKEKEKPNFDPSGILAKFASNAISEDKVLKFTEPLDAKIPV